MPLPDGEQRLEDRLVTTDGTFTGWGETVAFGENETAGAAFGRSYLQNAAAGVDAETNVLQVAVNFLFRDVRLGGYLLGRKWLVTDKINNDVANRLQG